MSLDWPHADRSLRLYPVRMDPITAMGRRPFLVSAWPWRAWTYLATASVPGALGLSVLAADLAVGGGLAKALIGIPILGALVLAGIPMGRVERWRLRLIDPEPIADPHHKPARPGVRCWLATRVREAATRRELGYALLFVTLLWPVDLAAALAAVVVPLALITSPLPVALGGQRGLWPGAAISTPLQAAAAVPVGLVLLVGGAYLVTALAAVQGRVAGRVLTAAEDLDVKLAEVTRSRARLVSAFEAERRRIERDLHDGAQQRLVAVSMSLGLARLDLPSGPVADQVAHAHEQAKLALTELRELIYGIYPQVLTDRGLPAAAEEAADRSPVPVDLEFRLDRRLPQAVEATAYFVISEALANIAKHSRAGSAWIRGELAAGLLVLEIGDDGVGGADLSGGSGLSGLVDRVAVVGGTVSVSSPPGGPTAVRAELPCP
jgi:signal transduction histidine kinase